MPPPSNTGNDNSASTAVVNHAQQVSGMRISVMPLVRMFSSVVMKLSAPSNEPTQKIAMLMTQRFMPRALSGAGNSSERTERRVTRPAADWSNRAAAAGE